VWFNHTHQEEDSSYSERPDATLNIDPAGHRVNYTTIRTSHNPESRQASDMEVFSFVTSSPC
jgi:hypothetical protein